VEGRRENTVEGHDLRERERALGEREGLGRSLKVVE
jgi:hypothetical protein